MRIGPFIFGGVAVLVGALLVSVPRYDRPPLVSEDFGPAALELVTLTNPRTVVPYNVVPEPLPAPPPRGPWGGVLGAPPPTAAAVIVGLR